MSDKNKTPLREVVRGYGLGSGNECGDMEGVYTY